MMMVMMMIYPATTLMSLALSMLLKLTYIFSPILCNSHHVIYQLIPREKTTILVITCGNVPTTLPFL